MHTLRSTLLLDAGVRHGFSLRRPGEGDAAELGGNLGRYVGDEPQRVEDNRRRFALEVGYAPHPLYEAEQVHGAAVQHVRAADHDAQLRLAKADVLVAREPGVAIGVRVADCVALLLFDSASGAVAAVHAGWRGLVAGAVEAGALALQPDAGTRSAHLFAAIFPHIGRCCFEVGEEVARALVAVSPDPDVLDHARATPHVDLRAIAVAKLLELGLSPVRLDLVPGCTRCDPQRFFSYRRDGQRSGRHVAAIVAP